MTKHLLRTLLLASLVALSAPALPQRTAEREPIWSCTAHDWYDDEPVRRCVLDRPTGMCVVIERREPGAWTYRVHTYTRGRPNLTEWGKNETVIQADGTILPRVRWWRVGGDPHGYLSGEAERERLRLLLAAFCREDGLPPELRTALEQVRAFATEIQTVQTVQPDEMSRP